VTEIQGWSPALERVFKEVVFRFLEEIHSTKAALYLQASDGSYVLVTQYGFGKRDRLVAEYPARDPVVLRVRELRNQPKAFQRPGEFPEVSRYLEGAGTGRLLLVPLFAGSKVLGFADVRDKGRRQPFVPNDLKTAKRIARSLVNLLADQGLYPDLELEPPEETLRSAASPGEEPHDASTLDDEGMAELCGTAVGLLGRGAALAALTIADQGGAGSLIFAAAQPTEKELAAVRQHQAHVMRRHGRVLPSRSPWAVEVRKVPGDRSAADALSISSAVLLELPGWMLTASVVTGRDSTSPGNALDELAAAANRVHRGSELRFIRRYFARSLVEPFRTTAPELVEHLEAVSRLAWRLAHTLSLDNAGIHEAATAGLLHDLGLTEFIGQSVLRHPTPGPKEHALYRRHVTSGEQKLRAAGFNGLAKIVRHHHERWDGGGYPDRLTGDAIPLQSRIVHVAEVYDTLVAEHSYRRSVPQSRALSIMRAAAGHQFDPTVVDALEQIVAHP